MARNPEELSALRVEWPLEEPAQPNDRLEASAEGSMTATNDAILKVFAISLLASVGVKYGELFLDFPFAPDATSLSQSAAACILIPTALNGE